MDKKMYHSKKTTLRIGINILLGSFINFVEMVQVVFTILVNVTKILQLFFQTKCKNTFYPTMKSDFRLRTTYCTKNTLFKSTRERR